MRTGAIDRYGNEFEWSPRTKVDAHGIIPRFESEITVAQVTGRFNNCDAYVAADDTWLSPLVGGPCLFNLYALVDNATYPILTGINPTLLPSFTTVGTQWRAYVAGVRGRVCDGFRLTVSLGSPTIDVPLGFIRAGTGVLYAWGEETAPGVNIETGGGIDVRITSPLPLPVETTGATVLAVREAPATAWTGLGGTAPDGSGGVTVATAIGAGAVTRYVDLSSDATNPPGSILYVKTTAGNLASASAYKLGPGDVAEGIEIDSQAKIFVLGSRAGLTWTAASV
jgi:hypothetical protein